MEQKQVDGKIDSGKTPLTNDACQRRPVTQRTRIWCLFKRPPPPPAVPNVCEHVVPPPPFYIIVEVGSAPTKTPARMSRVLHASPPPTTNTRPAIHPDVLYWISWSIQVQTTKPKKANLSHRISATERPRCQKCARMDTRRHLPPACSQAFHTFLSLTHQDTKKNDSLEGWPPLLLSQASRRFVVRLGSLLLLIRKPLHLLRVQLKYSFKTFRFHQELPVDLTIAI